MSKTYGLHLFPILVSSLLTTPSLRSQICTINPSQGQCYE
jgi:hypothetical protein